VPAFWGNASHAFVVTIATEKASAFSFFVVMAVEFFCLVAPKRRVLLRLTQALFIKIGL
jgi:hypothetical protein